MGGLSKLAGAIGSVGGALLDTAAPGVGAFIGGSIGNAIAGSSAAQQAGQMQANAANQASSDQMQMFNTLQNEQAPYRQAGQNALNQINTMIAPGGSMVTPFTNADLNANLAPNYAFQLQQGQGQVQNQANALGGLLGGNALQGLNSFTQNFANNAYQQAFNNYQQQQQNIYNRLASVAGLGQTASQATGQFGVPLAGQAGQFGTSGAAAQAAGLVGSANALNSGVGTVTGLNYLPSFLGSMNAPTAAAAPTPEASAAGYYGNPGSSLGSMFDVSSY